MQTGGTGKTSVFSKQILQRRNREEQSFDINR